MLVWGREEVTEHLGDWGGGAATGEHCQGHASRDWHGGGEGPPCFFYAESSDDEMENKSLHSLYVILALLGLSQMPP